MAQRKTKPVPSPKRLWTLGRQAEIAETVESVRLQINRVKPGDELPSWSSATVLTLIEGIEGWMATCGEEVRKTDKIRSLVEEHTMERMTVVGMVRDAISGLVKERNLERKRAGEAESRCGRIVACAHDALDRVGAPRRCERTGAENKRRHGRGTFAWRIAALARLEGAAISPAMRIPDGRVAERRFPKVKKVARLTAKEFDMPLSVWEEFIPAAKRVLAAHEAAKQKGRR